MKRIAATLADGFADILTRVLRLAAPGWLSLRVAERAQPLYTIRKDGVTYRFYCPNRLTHWRARTLFAKEPDTLRWIDTFRAGDTLFDIGANVGIFSVYAGLRGVRVMAFEPEAQNFAALNRNVFVNGLADHVTCYPLAFAESYQISFLNLPRIEIGGALSSVGQPLDWQHREFVPVFRQGVAVYTLDRFLADFSVPSPTHIKIDVDGAEHRILRGAEHTMRDPRLRSVLIEVNEALEAHRGIEAALRDCGFALAARTPSPLAGEGPAARVVNCLFTRK